MFIKLTFMVTCKQRWARFGIKVSTEAIPITLLLEKSIGKAILSHQISEVLSDEAIQVLLCKKFESAKRLYRFKPRNFPR
jgi:hypothetical protein